MGSTKNITIEVLTDLYYSRFIAIWRPEEEPGYVPIENDTRSIQQRNIPYLFVLSSMFEGRKEVSGFNPIVPSQHPMPPKFLKQQLRHVATMVSNGIGLFQPPSISHAETFLAKMRLGYTKVKTLKLTVSANQGYITLQELKTMLDKFTPEELNSIKVAMAGENSEDVYAKNLNEFIHTDPITKSLQYISVTKLANVYNLKNTYMDNSILSVDKILDSYAPGTETADMTVNQIALTQNAIDKNEADLTVLKKIDEINSASSMETDTLIIDVINEPTLSEIQRQIIIDLQKKIAVLEKK